MSAELAATLFEGSPCPVCGSLDHRDPKEPTLEAVSREREEAATAQADEAAQAASRAGEAVAAGGHEAAAHLGQQLGLFDTAQQRAVAGAQGAQGPVHQAQPAGRLLPLAALAQHAHAIGELIGELAQERHLGGPEGVRVGGEHGQGPQHVRRKAQGQRADRPIAVLPGLCPQRPGRGIRRLVDIAAVSYSPPRPHET